MASRLTRSAVDRQAAHVSGMMRDGIYVAVQGRNGAHGLDRYDRGGCVDTLTVGTLREVSTYLHGMAQALYIVGRDPSDGDDA